MPKQRRSPALWNRSRFLQDTNQPENHWKNDDIGTAWLKILKTQPVFTCSELTRETLEQGMKYVQS